MKTHGLSQTKGKRTRLYRIWNQMRQRCLNKNDSAYDRYGGRGITICSSWSDYYFFHTWAVHNGYKNNLEIDRIDNNGEYSPSNCHWVKPLLQARNKRNNHTLTLHGKTACLAEWSDLTGIKYSTLRSRIRLGWSTFNALTMPVRAMERKKLCQQRLN
ncbi:hypothetical protein LCGC14_2330850 [marine sediment metagenome]|uniref:HNH nuclease domain-containing protein n=1 Tax=marine sediment metagenome TaxID=412755 RepID=A0A0F9D2D1_9ZZZZ